MLALGRGKLEWTMYEGKLENQMGLALEAGKRLLKLCTINNLTIMNT